MCASTTVPMRTTDSRRLASSLSNVRRGMSVLAEAPCDVRLCPWVPRCVEKIGGGRQLDELAQPSPWGHQHEFGEGGDAPGPLHGVRDDHERVVAPQPGHEVLDLQGG